LINLYIHNCLYFSYGIWILRQRKFCKSIQYDIQSDTKNKSKPFVQVHCLTGPSSALYSFAYCHIIYIFIWVRTGSDTRKQRA
jgi:hypothetical protein